MVEQVVNPPRQAVLVFADTHSNEFKDRIFDELNSVFVVYQKPSYMFTDKEHRGPFEFLNELGNLSISAESTDTVVLAQRVETNDKDFLLSTTEKEDGRDLGSNGSAYGTPFYSGSTTRQSHGELALTSASVSDQAPASSFAIDDLLGLNFLLGGTAAPSQPLL
ncbi:hypothetical protein QN277_009164 [Acacia crassicarpa]|uniref:Uncharacterized protein n=1 Tax=Acacia crassicarpa TaxID=499986 RepID=A0AAE1JNC4_9FABA|nr:hypothetical protein QN277_009164 [Acacia crassicarpa]